MQVKKQTSLFPTMIRLTVFFLISFLVLVSCKRTNQKPFSFRLVDYNGLKAFDENGHLQAVIEIPTGTNKKIEFDKVRQEFIIDKIGGKDRLIDFLPYPGNYGFIPGTLSDKDTGGDGDPIDVLVLTSSLKTGTIIPVKPIATMVLYDEGERDTKIIALPVDSTLQTIKAKDFQSFMIDYDAAKKIIEDWFLNYDGYGTNRLEGWKDAGFGIKEVRENLH